MDVSSAVDWWEEWQLRILVLGSLFVQYLLFFSAPFRKFNIPSWCRSIIWLSYLGSDALAIYALATLFNRQSKRDYSSAEGNSILEVVWAPVLLMHLGGQDSITAYNIEDNELWRRHVLTAVSQITVAIYVFCKSWPGGDKRLLQAAILLFTAGILKCLEKPWALKSACFNSLVSLSPARKASRRDEAISLEEYVQKVRAFHAGYQCQAQGECQEADLEINHVAQAQRETNEVDLEDNRVGQDHREDDELSSQNQIWKKKKILELEAHKLFADLASSYPDRLTVLKSFLVHGSDKKVYDSLQEGIFDTSDRLYTNKKFVVMYPEIIRDPDLGLKKMVHVYVRIAVTYLPFAAIGLFHNSRREAYNVHDVKVTYALLCCTSLLEVHSWTSLVQAYSWMINVVPELELSTSISVVAQYSLVGFFASDKKHTKRMCASSLSITMLVLRHVKGWWKEHITDVASYWRFNDHRGQWTIQHKGCNQDLEWSLNMPFDESVLLWHIATDLCFHKKGGTSVSHAKATGCREISNYMIYLLFVNPEMLLSGTRRDLFMEANAELEEFLMYEKPIAYKMLKGKGLSSKATVGVFMQGIIAKLQAIECSGEDLGYTELPQEAMKCPSAKQGFIRDAWKISKVLLDLGDEKMWEVIEGVWVEMLCFSASRCRGYLHAKSMGSGVELLTYVWFLLSRMGMETLPERLQRTELPSGEGNAGAPPSTSQVHATEDPTRFRHSRSRSYAAAGTSSSHGY
ncbi:unnamed protein product [Alopecurus aequalis]